MLDVLTNTASTLKIEAVSSSVTLPNTFNSTQLINQDSQHFTATVMKKSLIIYSVIL
jgi:hypothetical protein